MYFRLKSNHTGHGGTTNTNYDSYRRFVLQDIQKLMTGDITAASGLNGTVFDRGSSVVTGSAPTAGIYSLRASDSLAYSSNDNWFQVKKYHHGKVLNSSFNASRTISMRWQDAWPIGGAIGTPDSTSSGLGTTNAFPRNDLKNFVGSTSTSTTACYGYDTPGYLYEINGIINDGVFAVTCKYGQADTSWSLSMCVVDQEYQPNMDDHFFSENSNYCPTQYWGFAEYNLEANNGPSLISDNTYRSGTTFGSIHRRGRAGTSNSTSNSSNDFHYGYYDTDVYQNQYESIFPCPWFDMPERAPVAGGNSGYIMQPLMKFGRHGLANTPTTNFHKDYKEYSMLRGVWRTNDNSFYTGERVTDSSGRSYRAMRLHKCGASSTVSTQGYLAGYVYNYPHSRSAVYLFPEDGQI